MINTAGEKKVYGILIKKGLTPEGAAGLIGNLEAESDGFYPNRVEYLCLSRLREHGYSYTDESYTNAVDSGRITRSEFLNPLPGKQYGYGLAQWTSPGRKAGLYDLCKKNGTSIADFDTQIEYLLKELETTYKSVLNVLKTTKSVREASDAVLKKFEIPADTSEAVCQSRAARGQKFYDSFVKGAGTVRSRAKVVELARSWLGKNEADGSYKTIIDIYNSMTDPFPRGCKMLYGWAWCACTWSAIAIKLGYTDVMPIEIGVEELVQRAKAMGIWVEDDNYLPSPADAIIYDWDDDGVGDCKGYSDHIGTVEKVEGNTITVIEGNYDNMVKRRVIQRNARYIRGYVTPKYTEGIATEPTSEPVPVPQPVKKDKLVKGDKGESVRIMQVMLSTCGYYTNSIDGDFGPCTETALKKFKKKAKIDKDGVYDTDTRKALENAYIGKIKPVTKLTVNVTTADLNIRTGAGIGYAATGFRTGIGCFSVTEVKKGRIDQDGTKGYWGKLLSGMGWICLAVDDVSIINI